ncbi:MAG: SCO family protein [Verrucomicrobia bacterium]|nr:MAG: SCO family protein [Verrucomicrobiota bacterium]
MDDTSEKLSRTIWIGVGLVIVLLAISFVLSGLKPRAPRPPLPVISQIADFTLTNQAGHHITLADVRGKVWIADIIFTRCAGPCPRMTQQMQSLQAALAKDGNVKLVTLTTDPLFDTPEVLNKYAEHYGADASRWSFLTGNSEQIANLAVDGLKLTSVEIKPEERKNPADLFIHSTIFVLVDKQARLRAIFQTGGEGVDWAKIQSELLAVVHQLEREP